ncbi:MAG: WYL domain-containing protein [Acidimicrobiales bacterium]|jgi:proteasome accessory factor C
MSAAPDTASRLRRLLAILTWLAQEGEAPIDEVAARFDLTPGALVAELEMAACCGVPPYTPDQLLEIVVTDETVSTRVGTTLARPRRLSPREGLALAASARALLAVTGSDEDGALSRSLAKLERALGQTAVEIELDTPELLDTVREALGSGERLAITYYSASTDQTTERTITPRNLFASEGHWYVDGWCESAGGVRRFRVDRIATAAPAGPAPADVLADGLLVEAGVAAPAGDGDAPVAASRGAFVPGPDSRRVRIAADPSMAWLLETVPSAGIVGEEGGRPVWEVFVGGDAWLERLLLRLGPDAVVVDPVEDRTLAPEAAARILERYRPSSS